MKGKEHEVTGCRQIARTFSAIRPAVLTSASRVSLLGLGMDTATLLPSMVGLRLMPQSRMALATLATSAGSNTAMEIFVDDLTAI